jgi:hypothetical protein
MCSSFITPTHKQSYDTHLCLLGCDAGLAGRYQYQCFGETHCIHLFDWIEAVCISKTLVSYLEVHMVFNPKDKDQHFDHHGISNLGFMTNFRFIISYIC